MFGRGKKSGSNPPKSDQVRKQNVDMFGMPDLSEFAVKDDFHVSDDVLEAELAALLDEDDDDGGNARPARRQQRPAPAKPAVDPMQQIAMMANEAMKDVDEADDDDDDDLDDEDLLAELAGISGSPEKPPPSLNVPASKATPRTPSPGPRTAVGQTPSPKPRPAPSPKPDTVPGLAPEPASTRRSPSPARKPVPAGPSPGTAGEPTDLASLLQHRTGCYQQAIASAERAEEGSKVRRYKRQLKILQDMQKKVKLGKPVNKDEIPPEVYVPKQAEDAQPPPQENVPAPAASQPTSAREQAEPSPSQSKQRDESLQQMLCVRRDQYKMAAVLAKRANDMATAAEYLKISKQFEAVIGAVEAGEEVDLSDMPPPPPSAPKTNASAPAPGQAPPSQAPVAAPRPPAEGGGGGGGGYAQPKTDLEAMLQRRERYSSMAQQAKEAQNDSKARRIGRIVKQYDDAIRKQKLGKPVDLSELAALPEFPPFPSQSGGEQAPPQVVHTVAGGASAPVAARPPAAGGPSGQGTGASHQASSRQQRPENSVSAKRPQSAKESMNQRNIAILKSKIAQFKLLALAAKRKGDMYEAKRLLKIAKEIEPMLAAAEGGLPVNMASIPKLPVEESVSSVSPPASPEPVEGFEVVGDAQDIYSRLIATLQKQIDICAKNAEIYGKLGNIKSVNRFKEYQEHCQQDLDVLVSKQSRGEPIPRHHYEQRTLPSVRVFPDIKDSEAEITIIQGTMLHCPSDAKDIDTYIKAEFPYPSDEPQGHKTGWAKGAENPAYNSTFTVDIGRGSRAFSSVVKRKALKMEVVYSKGLLRGHKTLGTASVKLADLESKCEIHESVPLMDGRKEIGGKIEVKIRIHHPLSGMKEDFIKEKWLIVDSVQRKVSWTLAANPTSSSTRKPGSTTAGSSTQARSSSTDSIEVLKWEIGTLKKKIADMQAHHQQVPKEFITSYTALQERLQKLQTYLREGGPKARQAYASRLATVAPNFLAQVKEALQAGQKEKASMYMTKKKLVETEMAALNRR
ncbi:coiled-coil and C2 domain-containing protein 1-like [Diadema antillarum]|uniref:coiled-coil and C2 domain-containing protein 1-like n=1 Tax=Diadema antillarum TaxID=105358 RepID=UPI003A8C60B6